MAPPWVRIQVARKGMGKKVAMWQCGNLDSCQIDSRRVPAPSEPREPGRLRPEFRPWEARVPRILLAALAFAAFAAPAAAQPKADGPPVSADSRLGVERFAAAPDIVQ